MNNTQTNMNAQNLMESNTQSAIETPLSLEQLPFGLKRYEVTEPESKVTFKVTAKSASQAKDKAYHNWFRGGILFVHFPKESLEVREV